MGTTTSCNCHRKKPEKSPKLMEKELSRVKTIPAEEIMRKSVWFIDKEEIDNYFSKDELAYYKRINQTSKRFFDMQIPTKPEEIRFFFHFLSCFFNVFSCFLNVFF